MIVGVVVVVIFSREEPLSARVADGGGGRGQELGVQALDVVLAGDRPARADGDRGRGGRGHRGVVTSLVSFVMTSAEAIFDFLKGGAGAVNLKVVRQGDERARGKKNALRFLPSILNPQRRIILF